MSDEDIEMIEVNLPWELGTDEHLNPETNVIYLVDEPEDDDD